MDHLNVKRISQSLLIAFLVFGNVTTSMGNTVADSWIYFARDAKNILRLCPKNESISYLTCLKHGTLELFDRLTNADVIPLTPNLRLIRYRDNDIGNEATNDAKGSASKSFNSRSYRNVGSTDIDAVVWSHYVMKRFLDVLSTHSIKMDFTDEGAHIWATEKLFNNAFSTTRESNMTTPLGVYIVPFFVGRARHRHRNQMLPMMSFGMTALGMILVPIGFQFLAVLGGKALLLAKMALLLASVNGVKRVANSGVHYGLYHTDPHPYHQGPWERSDHAYNRPRAEDT